MSASGGRSASRVSSSARGMEIAPGDVAGGVFLWGSDVEDQHRAVIGSGEEFVSGDRLELVAGFEVVADHHLRPKVWARDAHVGAGAG
jgi:hypothetical protein